MKKIRIGLDDNEYVEWEWEIGQHFHCPNHNTFFNPKEEPCWACLSESPYYTYLIGIEIEKIFPDYENFC